MNCFNKDIGNFGEDLSTKYLIDVGHKILNRNYRNKIGEIDIISLHNNIIIFTEVKSRYSNSYGTPLESVTYSKQLQIIKVSNLYLLINKLNNNYIRYDVIEIIFNTINDDYILNHIPDAFRHY